MSRCVMILAPNGHRVKISCNPDTSLLQVLEDACKKLNLDASAYDLKHYKNVLDLSMTIRFSNIPNNAMVEMIDAEKDRVLTNVTIGLSLPDGERKTGEFQPSASLYDVVIKLAVNEVANIQYPAISYMRQEVIGLDNMKSKTLKQLGLFGGRAAMRLLNKVPDQEQANVSSVYRAKPLVIEEKESDKQKHAQSKKSSIKFDPIAQIKNIAVQQAESQANIQNKPEEMSVDEPIVYDESLVYSEVAGLPAAKTDEHPTSSSRIQLDNLERRLNIENEVSFVSKTVSLASTVKSQIQESVGEQVNPSHTGTILYQGRNYILPSRLTAIPSGSPAVAGQNVLDQAGLQTRIGEQLVNLPGSIDVNPLEKAASAEQNNQTAFNSSPRTNLRRHLVNASGSITVNPLGTPAAARQNDITALNQLTNMPGSIATNPLGTEAAAEQKELTALNSSPGTGCKVGQLTNVSGSIPTNPLRTAEAAKQKYLTSLNSSSGTGCKAGQLTNVPGSIPTNPLRTAEAAKQKDLTSLNSSSGTGCKAGQLTNVPGSIPTNPLRTAEAAKQKDLKPLTSSFGTGCKAGQLTNVSGSIAVNPLGTPEAAKQKDPTSLNSSSGTGCKAGQLTNVPGSIPTNPLRTAEAAKQKDLTPLNSCSGTGCKAGQLTNVSGSIRTNPLRTAEAAKQKDLTPLNSCSGTGCKAGQLTNVSGSIPTNPLRTAEAAKQKDLTSLNSSSGTGCKAGQLTNVPGSIPTNPLRTAEAAKQKDLTSLNSSSGTGCKAGQLTNVPGSIPTNPLRTAEAAKQKDLTSLNSSSGTGCKAGKLTNVPGSIPTNPLRTAEAAKQKDLKPLTSSFGTGCKAGQLTNVSGSIAVNPLGTPAVTGQNGLPILPQFVGRLHGLNNKSSVSTSSFTENTGQREKPKRKNNSGAARRRKLKERLCREAALDAGALPSLATSAVAPPLCGPPTDTLPAIAQVVTKPADVRTEAKRQREVIGETSNEQTVDRKKARLIPFRDTAIVKMALIAKGFPRVQLTEGDLVPVHQILMEMREDPPPVNFPRVILGSLVAGAVMLKCFGPEAVTYLQKMSGKSVHGKVLQVVDAKYVAKPIKMEMKCRCTVGISTEMLFKSLVYQNQGLDTSLWEVVVIEEQGINSSRIILMDKQSAQFIEEKNYHLHLGFVIAKFKLLNDDDAGLGNQKAIAFMQPDNTMEVDDLSDDFYELTVDEVRRLYHGLQQERMKLENKPLLTSTLKQENEQKNIEKVLRSYKHAVVRIQFPNGIILQGVFAPTDTIQNVVDFLKQYLETPDKPFDIFTTPVTEKLDTSKTLLEANFVPCVLMHFKWLIDSKTNKYLKSSVYSNMTSGDAASLLASKYRSPCIQNRIEEPTAGPSRTSTSSNSKVPKWFRNKD